MELDFNIFKIEYNKVAPKKGRVLVSEPFLQDNYFKRSLVFLTDYSTEGTVGFVLNKPLELKVSEVMDEFPNINMPVSIGGPISTHTIHYIHTLGQLIPNSVHVYGNIFWGGDFDFIKDLLRKGKISQQQIRFFLGYSGWKAGQLEDELNQNSWVITQLMPEKIMNADANDWKEALSDLGEKYKIWSNFPENPSQN